MREPFGGSKLMEAMLDALIRPAFEDLADTLSDWPNLDNGDEVEKDGKWGGWGWQSYCRLSDVRWGGDFEVKCAEPLLESMHDFMCEAYAEQQLGEKWFDLREPGQSRREFAQQVWDEAMAADPVDYGDDQLFFAFYEPRHTWERQEYQDACDFEDEYWNHDESTLRFGIEADYRSNGGRDGKESVFFCASICCDSDRLNSWERDVPLSKFKATTARAAAKLMLKFLRDA